MTLELLAFALLTLLWEDARGPGVDDFGRSRREVLIA